MNLNQQNVLSNNLLLIGFFLCYSLLQLLECGVSGIMSQMVKFEDFLNRRPAGLKHERQLTSQENDGCQADEEGMKKDCLIIDMADETTGQKCNDYDERLKTIENVMEEMKTTMERYERPQQ